MTLPRKLKSVSVFPLLPPLLLALSLSMIFFFDNERNYFDGYTTDLLDRISMQSMAVASNLSPDHNFLMFLRQNAEKDARWNYDVYNRFPIGTYALIKLIAILPFGDDLSTQIYVARLLMLLFFVATATLAYVSISRVVDNRWIALASTLLAFSSYYWLSYNDMISTEVTSLFGIILTFHGMVIFVRDNRLRQLLIKVCVALLLGWHVMALLLPFVVLGIATELLVSRSSVPHSSVWRQMKYFTSVLIRSRYFALGLTALIFCASVMAFNIANEYFAMDRAVPFSELPTVKSYLSRTGLDSELFSRYPDVLDWQPFLIGQISRIGEMSIPFVFLRGYYDSLSPFWPPVYPLWLTVTGVLVFGACLAGLGLVRHKVVTAALLLSGWCWIIPLRGSAGIHEFEVLFHFGVPLVFFSLLLLVIYRIVGQRPPRESRPVVLLLAIYEQVWQRDRVLTGIGAAAAALFVLSVLQMDSPHNPETASFHRELTKDFSTIRRSTTPGDIVFVMEYGGHIWPRNMMNYYLNGRFVHFRGPLGDYGLTVSADRVDTDSALTPHNRHVFLYESSVPLLDDYRAKFQTVLSSEYAVRSRFDIHAVEHALYYVKDQCSWSDMETRFFLHIIPSDKNDLPSDRIRHGFDNLDFDFRDHKVMFDGDCFASLSLPSYDITHIRTGQFNDNGRVWNSTIPYKMFQEYPSIVSSAPVHRSNFDLYIQDAALYYIKDQCQPADMEARFFLDLMYAIPLDEDAPPSSHRQYRFDDFDFNFPDQGGLFGHRCMASVNLSQYDVVQFRTGQYTEDRELWDVTIPIVPSLIEAFFSPPSAPLVARSDFDLYLKDGALHYVKDPCDPADIEARFFLHITPSDENDLPSARVQHGFDNIDFIFETRGGLLDGRCVASVNLPPYDIDKIRTGQFADDGIIWDVEFAPQE